MHRRDDRTRDLTRLLDDLNGGETGAFTRLVDAVYDDLKKIANGRMAERFRQPAGALTLQPTAIADDAIMEIRRQRAQWKNSEQFFAIATRLIGRLVNRYQKHRSAQKRGAGKRGEPLEEVEQPDSDAECVSAVADALDRLQDAYPRQAEVVSLHVLCGHPLSRVMLMMGVDRRTVERDWSFGKAWLTRELKDLNDPKDLER